MCCDVVAIGDLWCSTFSDQIIAVLLNVAHSKVCLSILVTVWYVCVCGCACVRACVCVCVCACMLHFVHLYNFVFPIT